MMKALTDKKWKAFYISDEKENGIFRLRSSLSGIDKNKLLEGNDKETPYITRSDLIMELHCSLERNKEKSLKLTKEM